MSSTRTSNVATACLTAGALLLSAGCASVRPAARAPTTPELSTAPVKRVVQVAYGADATFVVCIEPACPKVTTKTLAQEGMVSVRAFDSASSAVAAGGPTGTPAAVPRPQAIVTFASGASGLTPDAKARLKAALSRYGSANRITVAGRTDNSGSAALNKALALARAAAVRDFLLKQQPALQGSVQVDAQGNCCFAASNESQGGRSRNRRVEVTFWGEGA